MHPNYEAELAGLLEGRRLVLLPVGARARVTAPGRFDGLVGVVVKRGRTRYYLRVAGGLLQVAFAAVEPA